MRKQPTKYSLNPCISCGKKKKHLSQAIRCHQCRGEKDRTPLLEKFWSYVKKTSNCWRWTGPSGNHGYGLISIFPRGKQKTTHRFSWEIHNGPIPGNLHVLHRCDVRLCVNPHHLFLGTNIDNIRDAVSKQRNVHGERVKNATLTNAQALSIKDSFQRASSKISNAHELAAIFGVTPHTVNNIVTGRRWRHLSSSRITP